jgi:N-acetylglucosaminyl-diphospho-decaprenol L-rhamnosyltransferase
MTNSRVAAVIVDFHAGDSLVNCISSLRQNGVSDIVVVENGTEGSANEVLSGIDVTLVQPGVNLGYGRGVNRGVAFTRASEYLLVSNPDVVVHEGAVASLIAFLDEHPDVGLVGPKIVSSDGSTYPSVRRFPNVFLAGTHALLSPWWKNNPWTKQYRSPGKNGRVDWVSGALFLVRRSVYELVGGFDERYFMFGEDMDLCWRVGHSNYRVDADLDAVVTHVEGVSRKRAPRAMTIAHHRSAIRFEWQTASGWRRLLAPLAISVLLLRLGLVLLVGKGHD